MRIGILDFISSPEQRASGKADRMVDFALRLPLSIKFSNNFSCKTNGQIATKNFILSRTLKIYMPRPGIEAGTLPLYHVAIKAGLYRRAVYHIPNLYPVIFSHSSIS